MSYEYKLEHYGAKPVDEQLLRQRLQVDSLTDSDYSISVEPDNSLYFASCRN